MGNSCKADSIGHPDPVPHGQGPLATSKKDYNPLGCITRPTMGRLAAGHTHTLTKSKAFNLHGCFYQSCLPSEPVVNHTICLKGEGMGTMAFGLPVYTTLPLMLH